MNTTWTGRSHSPYLATVCRNFAFPALERLATDIFLDLSTLEAAIKSVSMNTQIRQSSSQTYLGSWKLRATPGW